MTGLTFLTTAIGFQILLQNSKSLNVYNSAILCICMMVLLGFVDDVLGLRWRYKIILPIFAVYPLLIAYNGQTSIIIPNIISKYIGISIINLGMFYKLYMMLFSVFTTNAINIYAGINGIEIGQSIISASAIGICNIFVN